MKVQVSTHGYWHQRADERHGNPHDTVWVILETACSCLNTVSVCGLTLKALVFMCRFRYGMLEPGSCCRRWPRPTQLSTSALRQSTNSLTWLHWLRSSWSCIDGIMFRETRHTAVKCGNFYHELDTSNIPSVLWHCWLGDRKGIWPVKRCVLVCWRWWFDWSFARLIAPVVTTTSLSSNKIRVATFSYQPGKWQLKQRDTCNNKDNNIQISIGP